MIGSWKRSHVGHWINIKNFSSKLYSSSKIYFLRMSLQNSWGYVGQFALNLRRCPTSKKKWKPSPKVGQEGGVRDGGQGERGRARERGPSQQNWQTNRESRKGQTKKMDARQHNQVCAKNMCKVEVCKLDTSVKALLWNSEDCWVGSCGIKLHKNCFKVS